MTDISSFVSGLCGGLVGVAISHPIDTLRIRYQESHGTRIIPFARQIYVKESFAAFFRGISSPLFGVGLEKCVVFGMRDYIANMKQFENPNANSLVAGFGAGLTCSFVVTPVERIKIILQQKLPLGKLTPSYLYQGLASTFTREIPGYMVYFVTYDTCLRYDPEPSLWRVPFYGAISGLLAWLVIYPSDPIKTKIQSQTNGKMRFSQAATLIYKEYGWRGFYRGTVPALVRAMVLHSGVFFGYEFTKRLL